MGFSTRTRKCAVKTCRKPFVPMSMTHKACGPECAQEVAKASRLKKERQQDRASKERLKTRSDWIKDAQNAFNGYIRFRDIHQPCICCGMALGNGEVGGAYDCGHYRSVGSAPHLRFDERNAHAQRKQCNRYGAGRAVDYRIGLINRLGLAAVEALESDQTARKWSIEDLKAIRDTYRAKLKDMKKGIAA